MNSVLPSPVAVTEGLIQAQSALWKVQCRGEIAHIFAHAWKRFEVETHGKEFYDRGGVVGSLVHKAAFGERRDDKRRDPCCRSKAVTPTRS